MATGACGINCDVCQLNLIGQCSSCGPGRSDLAARKSAAQQRILGHPCAILECARLNHIDYCPRDCPSFPCDNFSDSNYPYGKSFLDMQQRRLKEGPKAYAPDGSHLAVADEYWQALTARHFPATTLPARTIPMARASWKCSGADDAWGRQPSIRPAGPSKFPSRCGMRCAGGIWVRWPTSP